MDRVRFRQHTWGVRGIGGDIVYTQWGVRRTGGDKVYTCGALEGQRR